MNSPPHLGHVRLAAALARLERAFGPRRDRIAPMHACGHCFNPGDLRVMAGPVDEIPDRLFARAVWKWDTTMDADVAFWRRLTPRILRLLAAGCLHIDATLVARKFNQAAWRDWPEDERSVVAEFCEAWFEAALTEPEGPAAVEVLPFVAILYGDVARWLAVWSATPGRRADRQLAEPAGWWLPDLLGGALDLSFSGELPDVAAEMTAWLLDQAPTRIHEGDLSPDDACRLAHLALPKA